MLRNGLPCWRTSQPLECTGRYSLVFPCGRRAIVLPSGTQPSSLGEMAQAKCDYQIFVRMDDELTGRPKGYLKLTDLTEASGADRIRKPGAVDLRGMSTFPELRSRPVKFRRSYFLGSMRLLLRGELKVPPPCLD